MIFLILNSDFWLNFDEDPKGFFHCLIGHILITKQRLRKKYEKVATTKKRTKSLHNKVNDRRKKSCCLGQTQLSIRQQK